MPDGTYLCAGTVGWKAYPAAQQAEVEAEGLFVRPHPNDADAIMVGSNRLFVQRSTDGGNTWERQEWTVPGVEHLTAFPRSAWLGDGTILVSLSTVPTPMLVGEPTSGGQGMAERHGVGCQWGLM